jgi:hypothetical protein
VHHALRTVVYASAGFDVAFTFADGGRIRHLPPTATMLGLSRANRACDTVFTLSRNETLVIATDGVSNSRTPGSSDFFGPTLAALAVTRSLSAGTDPALAVFTAARAHEGPIQAYDVAVLVARLQRPRQSALRQVTDSPRLAQRRDSSHVQPHCRSERPQLTASGATYPNDMAAL